MMVPARNMSCDSSDRSSSGPTVGRLSTTEMMMLPETSERQQVADGAGERVERDAHRVFQDHPALRQAPGARGHDVGPAQLVEQVGAHDADELRGAGQRQDQHRHRQVLQQIPTFAQAPGRQLLIRRENRPPTLHAEQPKPKYITISASRKFGIARPMKPRKVKT